MTGMGTLGMPYAWARRGERSHYGEKNDGLGGLREGENGNSCFVCASRLPAFWCDTLEVRALLLLLLRFCLVTLQV